MATKNKGTMKKFSIYLGSLLCSLFMMASLSSCLNDNDSSDNSIDATTQKSYQYQYATATQPSVARFYYTSNSGYYGYQNIVKYDSITNGAGTRPSFVTDSTYTLRSFPVCKLDSAINIDASVTTGTYRELYEAIHNSQETASITGYHFIYSSSYASSTSLQYVMQGVMQVKLTYGGQTHNVGFYFAPSYSYGVYTASTRSNEFQLYLAAIYPDFDINKTLSSQTALSSTYFNPLYIIFTQK